MRCVLFALAVFTMLFLSGCMSSQTVTLEAALQATEAGEYSLIVVTDTFVTFQNQHRKDQYYFTGPLPETTATAIKSAIEHSKSKEKIHYEDARPASERPKA